MKKNGTIRWRTKLLLISVLIIIITGTSLTGILHNIREKFFHHYLTELVGPINTLIGNQIVHNMRYHEPDHFQGLLESFRMGDDLQSIAVANSSGRIVFSAEPDLRGDRIFIPEPLHSFQSTPENMYTYEGNEEKPTTYILSVINNLEDCRECHEPSNSHLGFIETRISGETEKGIHRLLLTFDVVGTVVIVLIILGIVLYSHYRYFQTPYDKIKTKILAIQQGDLDTPLDIKTPGELNYLADYISSMATSLKKAQAELQSLHQRQLDRAGQLARCGGNGSQCGT